MAKRFDSLLEKYHDPVTPEFDKGYAKGAMDELDWARMQWNKENNPTKYNEDMAKREQKKADYYAKEALKSSVKLPKKAK